MLPCLIWLFVCLAVTFRMDEGFSGVVRLSNISDFIAPNLNCIIPLETTATAAESLVAIRKRESDDSGAVKPVKEKKIIKVSLNDCLACNGCITSAETVLVEEQSLARLLAGVSGCQLSVVTVSPQTVCSIAAKRSISNSQAAQLISSYFKSIGITYIVDSSFGRIFSLEAAYQEFVGRSERPLLASACPGFVCYAEKTHGSLLIPLISNIRSPQSIQGALVKDYVCKKHSLSACSVYHASVMPCFDKKLEASRPDFVVDGTEVRETDCVVSTAELNAALDEFTPSTQNASSTLEENGWLSDFSRGILVGSSGGSSGGYADNIIERFMQQNHQRQCEMKTSKVAKNMDLTEVTVDGAVQLRVARVYGFRNIQNLVRKLKSGKCNYDYVEVMACPGGCANGGGQLRGESTAERDSMLAAVEEQYAQLRENRDPERNMNEYSRVAADWSTVNPNWRSLVYTKYHSVETNITQNLQW